MWQHKGIRAQFIKRVTCYTITVPKLVNHYNPWVIYLFKRLVSSRIYSVTNGDKTKVLFSNASAVLLETIVKLYFFYWINTYFRLWLSAEHYYSFRFFYLCNFKKEIVWNIVFVLYVCVCVEFKMEKSDERLDLISLQKTV